LLPFQETGFMEYSVCCRTGALSSDLIPGHFRTYGRTTNNTVWSKVISKAQAAVTKIQAIYSPTTGLLPDFIGPAPRSNSGLQPAPPKFLEGPHDGHYYYNAGRVPWRIATDALLNNDPVSFIQAGKIAAWAARATNGNPKNIKGGYKLNGRPLPGSGYFSTLFAAPLGVAAMTVPNQQTWLNSIYDAVYAKQGGYFEDSVTLLCLLVMTGNFWDPSTIYSRS